MRSVSKRFNSASTPSRFGHGQAPRSREPDRWLDIRRAGPAELPEIASRRWSNLAWDFLVQHTPEEDLGFIGRLHDAGPIWTALQGDRIVGFCAARRGWIDLLHVAPELHGMV